MRLGIWDQLLTLFPHSFGRCYVSYGAATNEENLHNERLLSTNTHVLYAVFVFFVEFSALWPRLALNAWKY